MLIPRYLRRVIISVLLVVIVVPIGYMVLMSFTPNQDVALGEISLRVLGVRNYVDLWSAAPLAAGLLHTVIIAGSAAVVSVFVALLAAYPLTRLEFKGRRSYLYTWWRCRRCPVLRPCSHCSRSCRGSRRRSRSAS